MSNASVDFLAGGGPPSAKFKTYGDTTGGKIIAEPKVEQQRDPEDGTPQTWSDGNPKLQMVVTVQTDLRDPAIDDDDGKRRIFVRGAMRNAVQKAVIDAGANGLDVGGELYVTYTSDGEQKNRAFSPPKQYVARYTAAPVASAGDFLGTAQVAAAPPAISGIDPALLSSLPPEALAALANLQKTS